MEDDPIIDLGSMEPAKARKLINAARKVTFFMHVDITLPSSEDRAYPYGTTIALTARQAMKVCDECQRFRELKRERDPGTPEADLPKINVRRSKHCMFIG